MKCTEIQVDTLIWRYMDLASFLYLLQKSQLAFRRVDTFEDHFEGHLPRALELRVKDQESHHKQQETQLTLQQMRLNTHVVCWNISDQECYAMWKIYGREENSVCINTTVGRLQKALQKAEADLELVKIHYIDMTSRNIASEVQVQNVNFKDVSFQYENEVRLLTSRKDAQTPDSSEDQEPPVFEAFDVNLDALIQNIYVNPNAGDHLPEIIADLCQHYHGDIQLQDRIQPSRFLWQPEF
ncbi:DUF2971 domain-containing protein [Deinococcus roseus]|uniref:DUF2971 domain-containing protein n=1 Tax=Deinococcus roseus TaxID=392414 RepID=UPI001665B1FE|nr:DUF2971 domain-containing protein [Deinococcus roseus]